MVEASSLEYFLIIFVAFVFFELKGLVERVHDRISLIQKLEKRAERAKEYEKVESQFYSFITDP